MQCLWSTFSNFWIFAYESLLVPAASVKQLNDRITLGVILKDLEHNRDQLDLLETKLEAQSESLLHDAKERMGRKDSKAARKKLMERRSINQQLDRLRSSQHVISMHLGAMQGAELNQTLMTTLKASSHAIQAFAPEKNLRDVEDVMFELEKDMKAASEINDALSKPIITFDSMGLDAVGGGLNTEEELERELESLLNREDDQSARLAHQPLAPHYHYPQSLPSGVTRSKQQGQDSVMRVPSHQTTMIAPEAQFSVSSSSSSLRGTDPGLVYG